MQHIAHEVKDVHGGIRSHARHKAEEAEFRRKASMKDGANVSSVQERGARRAM